MPTSEEFSLLPPHYRYLGLQVSPLPETMCRIKEFGGASTASTVDNMSPEAASEKYICQAAAVRADVRVSQVLLGTPGTYRDFQKIWGGDPLFCCYYQSYPPKDTSNLGYVEGPMG